MVCQLAGIADMEDTITHADLRSQRDAQLVRAAQKGNHETFNELVLLYQEAVYNLAYRMLGDPDHAPRIVDRVVEHDGTVRYASNPAPRQMVSARTAEQMRVMNEKLRELQRVKDDFLSSVSHELRTPLTSIRSFSEILLDHPEAEDGVKQQFLSIINQESERLTRLVNDVLDLARIEAARSG